MKLLRIDLYEATDSESSYAIRLPNDSTWRAENGIGADFKKVWSVDFESRDEMEE